jgi:hypothetical protein
MGEEEPERESWRVKGNGEEDAMKMGFGLLCGMRD